MTDQPSYQQLMEFYQASIAVDNSADMGLHTYCNAQARLLLITQELANIVDGPVT